MKKSSGYRVLDANYNRLREALRVCEDVNRFVLSSNALAISCKRLRHRVTKLILSMPITYREIVSTRDSENDCGRRSFMMDKKKEHIRDVFIRNVKRAEEATRVIEEFTKLIDVKIAFQFQKIRFGIYDLEKKTIAKL
ncbi:thiamine-phosphate pyrophosphorylase [Candidatus Omnitrophota bacterium]